MPEVQFAVRGSAKEPYTELADAIAELAATQAHADKAKNRFDKAKKSVAQSLKG